MPGPEGSKQQRDLAGTGKIIVVGIFGVYAALDGMAANHDVILREGQLLSSRDANLQVHQIEPGDQFRHRMLNLQPRVHLEEIEILLLVDQKLDRAGIGISGGLATRTATSPMRRRMSGSTMGEGASSTTF